MRLSRKGNQRIGAAAGAMGIVLINAVFQRSRMKKRPFTGFCALYTSGTVTYRAFLLQTRAVAPPPAPTSVSFLPPGGNGLPCRSRYH